MNTTTFFFGNDPIFWERSQKTFKQETVNQSITITTIVFKQLKGRYLAMKGHQVTINKRFICYTRTI